MEIDTEGESMMYQEYFIIGISFIGIAIILALVGLFSGRKKKQDKTVVKPVERKVDLDKTETIYSPLPDEPMQTETVVSPIEEGTVAMTYEESDKAKSAVLGGSQTASGKKAYQALQAGAVVNEKYRVERVLGEGAQGSVYVCTNIELGNMWAMKHFQGGLNEKDILVKLNHVSLPKIADVFTDGDDRYIVESFVEGFPLHKFAEKNGESFHEDMAIAFMIQLAEALQYIHKQNIIHMDIKPQNIIITEDLKAILIDFGIASLRDGEKAKTYEIRGYTPSFASPEQIAFQKDIDERTDIYSLGATIAYIFRKIPLGKEFTQILNRCMSEDKEHRYSDVKSLRDALLLLQKQKIDALHRQKRNRLLRRLAIPLVVFGISSLAYYGYLQQRERSSELILPQVEYILSEQKEMPISVLQRYQDGKERILADKWLNWQSDNPEIAVLENGVILAKNAGTTTISGNYYGKEIKIPIQVEAGVLGVDVSLKYSKTANTKVYAGTGERESVDGEISQAAFFEPVSMTEWKGTKYIADGKLREIESNQVDTIDLDFLDPRIIKGFEDSLYISMKAWQDEGNLYIGIFRLLPAWEELEEVFSLPSDFLEISDFLPTDKGLYLLMTDFAEDKTDVCFYDFALEEIEVIIEGEEELNSIVQTNDGKIYISQAKNNMIYQLTENKLEYFAGAKFEKDFTDGAIPKFYHPMALATNGRDLYVWDYHMLRKIILLDGKIEDTVTLSGQAEKKKGELVLEGKSYEVSYENSEKVGLHYANNQIFICQPNSSYIRVVEE
ncbi:MAG: serine/threonine-protein kinase [Eubacteriales bacterium]|nr:serine/threonine-protein kinase [Eubacteriales bacterium]